MRNSIATIPEAPDFLEGAALRKWSELAPQKEKDYNLDLLAAYCVAYGRWRDMEDFLALPGDPIYDDDYNQIGNRDRRLAPIYGKLGIVGWGPSVQLKISQQAVKEMAFLTKALDL